MGDTFAALDDAIAEIAQPRLQAIAALRRQGWSYDRIAEATQLSKGRVAQLARETRSRRLKTAPSAWLGGRKDRRGGARPAWTPRPDWPTLAAAADPE